MTSAQASSISPWSVFGMIIFARSLSIDGDILWRFLRQEAQTTLRDITFLRELLIREATVRNINFKWSIKVSDEGIDR
jgi:hypothetical protein